MLLADARVLVTGAASGLGAALTSQLRAAGARVLATDVRVVSVFAEPRNLVDKDEAVELLTAVLPDLDATDFDIRLRVRSTIRARRPTQTLRKAPIPASRNTGATASWMIWATCMAVSGVGFMPLRLR